MSFDWLNAQVEQDDGHHPPAPPLLISYEYLGAIYKGMGHVYALFTSNRLHCHHEPVARFTSPGTATSLWLVRTTRS